MLTVQRFPLMTAFVTVDIVHISSFLLNNIGDEWRCECQCVSSGLGTCYRLMSPVITARCCFSALIAWRYPSLSLCGPLFGFKSNTLSPVSPVEQCVISQKGKKRAGLGFFFSLQHIWCQTAEADVSHCVFWITSCYLMRKWVGHCPA